MTGMMRKAVEGSSRGALKGIKPRTLAEKKFRVMSEREESVISLSVTACSSQGERPHMEDKTALAYIPFATTESHSSSVDTENGEVCCDFLYVGVFDGHGGEDAALYAKEKLMEHIRQQPGFSSLDDELMLQAIKDGFRSLQEAMKQERENWPKTSSGHPSTAGTTASVAFIRNGKLYTGHVGDSRIVLGFHDPPAASDTVWEAGDLTTDHKPESETEKARIEASGGKVVVARGGVSRVVWRKILNPNHKGAIRKSTRFIETPFLSVARSLGDYWSYNDETNTYIVSPEPDVNVIKLDPRIHRCILFASDGVWSVLSSQDSIKCVQEAHRPETPNVSPSQKLVNEALTRCGPMRSDNISVVTLMLSISTDDVSMTSDENTVPQSQPIADSINKSQDIKQRRNGSKVKSGRTSQRKILPSRMTDPVSPLTKKPLRKQTSRTSRSQLSTRNSQREFKMPPKPMKVDDEGDKKSSTTLSIFEQITTGVRRLTRGQTRLIRNSDSQSQNANIVNKVDPDKNVQIQRATALELKSRLSPDIIDGISSLNLIKSQSRPISVSEMQRDSPFPSTHTLLEMKERARKSSTFVKERMRFIAGEMPVTRSQSSLILNGSPELVQTISQTPNTSTPVSAGIGNPHANLLIPKVGPTTAITPIMPPVGYVGGRPPKLARRKLSDTRHPTPSQEIRKRRCTIATKDDAQELCPEFRRVTRSVTKAQ